MRMISAASLMLASMAVSGPADQQPQGAASISGTWRARLSESWKRRDGERWVSLELQRDGERH